MNPVPRVHAEADVAGCEFCVPPGRAPVVACGEEDLMDLDAAGHVVLAENLAVLRSLPDSSIDLVYIDPPFNTGRRQTLRRLRTVRDAAGDRTGFQGKRYRTIPLGATSYVDIHDDYLDSLEEVLTGIRRVLKETGSLYLHLDCREVHYCKVLLDAVFGRESFLNEIIWAYDYGARSRRRWPAKHDNILLYVKDPERYFFDIEAVTRIPYLAPGLVGPEKAARGKTPTDTWWHTIVPPGGKERTGYPNQKPLGILRRIVQASSPPGGLVADFFAGSGTTGVAAAELGRRFLLVDNNPQACRIMAERLGNIAGVVFVGFRASASSSRRQTVEGTDPDRPARDGCEAQNGRPGRRENRPGPSRTRPR